MHLLEIGNSTPSVDIVHSFYVTNPHVFICAHPHPYFWATIKATRMTQIFDEWKGEAEKSILKKDKKKFFFNAKERKDKLKKITKKIIFFFFVKKWKKKICEGKKERQVTEYTEQLSGLLCKIDSVALCRFHRWKSYLPLSLSISRSFVHSLTTRKP